MVVFPVTDLRLKNSKKYVFSQAYEYFCTSEKIPRIMVAALGARICLDWAFSR